jgi:uncharacterized cupin superfamily protein
MVPEAPLEQTEHGLVPAGKGWLVLNARDARWVDRGEGRGVSCSFETFEGEEADFWELGINLRRLEPGEPMAMYHFENDEEAFLVLSGEALLIVEGEERPLRQWDLFHCPAGTNHVIVGAGDEPCVIVGAGTRVNMGGADSNWGAYTVDETAQRHGAGVERETTDAEVAYAPFPQVGPTRYREGWLPG